MHFEQYNRGKTDSADKPTDWSVFVLNSRETHPELQKISEHGENIMYSGI